jgi:hypothetical protein
MKFKALVGCEESQTVTKALRKVGVDAKSCDLEPTRGNPEHHIQGDIVEHLKSVPEGYYDLGIFHIDCTTVAVSGNRWYGRGMPRHQERIDYINWVESEFIPSLKKKCKRIAIENPKSVIFPILRKYGFRVYYVHPWQFGHTEQKETGFAVVGLPTLKETNNVYEEMMLLPKQEREKVFRMPPGPNRKRDRSVTYQGIADAIANQWGGLVKLILKEETVLLLKTRPIISTMVVLI